MGTPDTSAAAATAAPPVENFRLAAALEYAAAGRHVLPLHWPRFGPAEGRPRCSCGDAACKSVGKHPLTAHGLKDASTDPAAVRAWWARWPAANVGVATGGRSGVVVLDVDGEAGKASALALFAAHPPPPDTVEAETGGGGWHLVYAHPGTPVPNSAGKLGPGLDVRGDGGYVVAAPSLHASGRRYAWVPGAAPADRKPAPLPGWLLGLMTAPDVPPPPRPAEPAAPRRYGTDGDTAGHWLGRALLRAADGNRNDTGLWLAAQLRDAGIAEAAAEPLMREYARRAPAGGEPYREREAVASLRSAYRRPAREPARSLTYAAKVVKALPQPPAPADAAAELAAHYEDIFAGRFYNVPFPWDNVTNLTQALLPGSVTVFCGEPGAGKTYCLLECLRFWMANGYDPAALFLEKDRKFYARRLVAQLEGNARFCEIEWLHGHAAEARAAVGRHRLMVAEVGRLVHTANGRRYDLDGVLAWVRQQASAGRRVIVVDPITAAAAGVERWTKDDDFVTAAGQVATAHGVSLVLVTHPKKGSKPGYAGINGHDVAAGAAYYRFADAVVWLHRTPEPKAVAYRGAVGPGTGRFRHFMELTKTRDGPGSGWRVAFVFDDSLRFKEIGVVTGDAPDDGGGEESEVPA